MTWSWSFKLIWQLVRALVTLGSNIRSCHYKRHARILAFPDKNKLYLCQSNKTEENSGIQTRSNAHISQSQHKKLSLSSYILINTGNRCAHEHPLYQLYSCKTTLVGGKENHRCISDQTCASLRSSLHYVFIKLHISTLLQRYEQKPHLLMHQQRRSHPMFPSRSCSLLFMNSSNRDVNLECNLFMLLMQGKLFKFMYLLLYICR